MKTVCTSSVLVLALLAAVGRSEPPRGDARDKGADKKPKKRFTVSKETTYVTGPLDKDGYVDYVAALNKQLSKGVTPANNANVLLWKALGPHPEGATVLPEYFKWLGVPQPPEKGDYFLPLDRFLQDQLKLDKATANILARDDRTRQRPWKATDNPAVAAWLKANEKPLTVLLQATRRPHYFNPLIPERTKNGPSGLPTARLPAVQGSRDLANALVDRAMLRLGQGDAEGAWQDLLACHRLARLVSRGGCAVEALVGSALDAVASRADLVWLEAARPNARRLKQCLDDLRKLPPLVPSMATVGEGERFWPLEMVLLIDRYGASYLDDFLGSIGVKLKPLARLGGLAYWGLFLREIDWDPALRGINHWYDRAVAALRVQDRVERDKKLAQIEAEVKELRGILLEPEYLASYLRGANATAAKRGEYMGKFLICLLMPALRKPQDADDRARQTQDNLAVAFALEWYKRDHGRYPKTLDALSPKYLAKLPRDRFSGKPLDYRPSRDGYLLSCMADIDLSIRLPLPAPPGP
jgi:hypothetical protein